MFTKPFNQTAKTALKKSDARAVRESVLPLFPFLVAEQLTEMLEGQMRRSSVSTHFGQNLELISIVPSEEDEEQHELIYFIRMEGVCVPTLRALASALHKSGPIDGLHAFYPSIVVNNGGDGLLRSVQRGSHLFLAGVVSSTSTWQRNECRAVVCHCEDAGLCVIAVARLEMSAKDAAASDGKGHAATIVNVVGDLLPQTPADPIPLHIAEPANNAADDDDDVADEEAADVPTEHELAVAACAFAPDTLLLYAFAEATLALSKQKEPPLPMLLSKFYSEHVLPSRPHGSDVQIKRTQWKKVGAFARAMAAEGVIDVADNTGVLSVTAVHGDAPLLLEHAARDERKKITLHRDAEAPTQAGGGGGGDDAGKFVTQLYRAPAAFDELFRAINADHDRKTSLYTRSQCAAALNGYCARHELVTKNGKAFQLDDLLQQHLRTGGGSGKGKKKGGQQQAGNLVPRSEAAKLFLDCLAPCYRLERSGGVVRRGAVPSIEIAEVKYRNHNVTRLRNGAALFVVDGELAALARDCNRKFAASASLAEDAQNKKFGQMVVVQGWVGHDLKAYLCDELGIPAHLVKVSAQKKKKGR